MVTVNDLEDYNPFTAKCWICGHTYNHYGISHSNAFGDGVTRYQIVDIMNANGWTWRNG